MAFIQVPPDSTGKEVEATTDGTLYRQVINIGQNAASGSAIAPVDATNGLAVDNKTLPPGASTAAKQDTGNTSLAALTAQSLDYDTGAGTAAQVVFGIALPASGGPVAGGTATNPIQVSLANTAANATAVKVDASATTQPVSGTVTANQGGTWTATVTQGTATNLKTQAENYQGGSAVSAANPLLVSLANTAANATAVKVDGSAVTQPVSGTFWQATQPVSGTVTAAQATASSLNATVVGTGTFATQATLQAGTALIGSVAASGETSTVYSGTTALTPKFAVITASASGATTLVAAVTSKKIRVTNIVLIANGTVNVKFQSHVTPTDKTGLLYLVANMGFAPGYDPTGHFETIAGEALDINLSGAVAVGGWLKYLEV